MALSFVFLAAGIVLEQLSSGLAAEIAQYILFGLSYFIVGWKILWNTVKNLSRGEIFDENFLMTVASIGAIALGQYAEAAEVMALYSLGELLQSIAVGASRRSIASLMQLKSETATLLTEQGEKIVPPEEIKKGDRLLIKAGEKIAADGVIVRGRTSLDTRSLSGEAMLRDVGEGDKVLGGCINVGGVIEVVAEKDYSESTVARSSTSWKTPPPKRRRASSSSPNFPGSTPPSSALRRFSWPFSRPCLREITSPIWAAGSTAHSSFS